MALGWEAVHVACQGRPAWRRTERLVAAAGAWRTGSGIRMPLAWRASRQATPSF